MGGGLEWTQILKLGYALQDLSSRKHDLVRIKTQVTPLEKLKPMPLDLNQRLSEFSYGYGVTREVQTHLESIGLRPVPFLPSLLHEAKIGCDVHFDRPGIPLMIQFKLGQELKNFRRKDKSKPAPELNKPFWRFNVNTAEIDGQYDLLLKAERAGGEVHYVAPRFANWDQYATAFQSKEILENSLFIKPSEIDKKLQILGEPDGQHKIAYDASRVYVCSTPKQIEEYYIEGIADKIRSEINNREEPVIYSLRRIFDSFSQRRDIRQTQVEEPIFDGRQILSVASPEKIGRSPQQMAKERTRRLKGLTRQANTENDAIFAAVGIETWAAGIQLFAVTSN